MKVVVGICTFRRKSLLDTLLSIAQQSLAKTVQLSVIVADNDDEALLGDFLSDAALELGLKITYVHAPARNISIARNACLDHARGDYLALIDDDETADPNWLSTLLNAARNDDIGVVFGPSHAIYPDNAPAWMKDNAFHSNIPQHNNFVVETGFSCNTLLNLRDGRVRNARFDLAFGRTGGEDIDFFFRLHRDGVNMKICETANVYEEVDPKRMSADWILSKSQAKGVIYGSCAINGQTLLAAKMFAKSALKAGYCWMQSLTHKADETKSMFWRTRGQFHLGVLKSTYQPPTREFYGKD